MQEADQICKWLTTLTTMCLVWLIVTLVTDSSSVFYRKAIIYKKRVDGEVTRRKTQMMKESINAQSDQAS